MAAGFSCDAVIIAYVLHHVPTEARPAFWRDVAALRANSGFSRLSVVDLETNSIRSSLSLLSDHWITGPVPSDSVDPGAIKAAGKRQVDYLRGNKVITSQVIASRKS